MADFTLREYGPEDLPTLMALWQQTFGDDPAFLEAFFRLLPEMGLGVVACRESAVVGAAYLLTGLRLDKGQRWGYLYAVAVSPSERGCGLGRALSQTAAALGRARGVEGICTLPAEASLYPWYEDRLGLGCALYRKRERTAAAPGPAVTALSPADYGRLREKLLQAVPHMIPSLAVLTAQEALCRAYGGGLYAVGEGIAAAYREQQRCLVRELIAPPEADRLRLAGALGAALGAGESVLYSPAEEGEPYLAADLPLPEGCVWNLTLD